MIYDSFDFEENTDMFKQQQQQSANNNESIDLFDFMNQAVTFNDDPFSVPQLTPDGQQENIFVKNNVLSGHNTEYNMSPLQISSHNTIYTPLQHPTQSSTLDDFADEEEFLTPLVSPAMAPTYDINNNNSNYQFNNNNSENIFSPLSSPALHPSSSVVTDQHALQQKLALIERQQQQLRSMQSQINGSTHHNLSPATSPLFTYTNDTRKKINLHPKIAAQSPQTKLGLSKRVTESSPLALGPINNNIAPATPSLLMKLGAGNSNSAPPTASSSFSSAAVDNMSILPAAILEEEKNKTVSNKRRRISQPKFNYSPALTPELSSPGGLRPLASPRTLKPLISPSLKPNGHRLSTIEEETARALLTSKSNYENQKEGNGKTLGIDFTTTIQSGVEHRRSAHKAAEQKRRDVLKQSFDSLRTEIIDAMVEEEMAESGVNIDETEMKNTKEKDVKQMSKVVLLQHSYEHIVRLKSDNKKKEHKMDLMKHEIMSLRKRLGMPEITEQEKEEDLKEKEEENQKRKERLKRLKNATILAGNSSTNNDE